MSPANQTVNAGVATSSRSSQSFVHKSWAPIAMGIIAAVVGVALLYIPWVGSDFSYTRVSQILIMMTLLMGLGIVTGTAGMIALCQMTFAAASAWIIEYLEVHMGPTAFGEASFFIYMIAGAVAATIIGVLVGLPAIRLRGVNLAVVTLSLAFAMDLTIVYFGFPANKANIQITRPFGIGGSTSKEDMMAVTILIIAIVAIVSVALVYLQRSRWGSSWKMVAFSERGTASSGTSVQVAKLTAFAVSAFVGGIAGGLYELVYIQARPESFGPYASIVLYVLATLVGSYLIDMALFGGILSVVIPFILTKLKLPMFWGDIFFGVASIQGLTTGSNLGEDIRRGLRKGKRAQQAEAVAEAVAAESHKEIASVPIPQGTGKPLLVVENLTVAFGAVKANSDVNLVVKEGTIFGLIGPNGAGKSTFIDAISGFLPHHTGEVTLDGLKLDKLSPSRIARNGLRRTYQQDRVPSTLSVGAYLKFIARGKASHSEIDEILDFFGCPTYYTPLSVVDVGTRRLIEVAAGVASKPKLLMLDEPAAGLDHEQHIAFGERLRQVPTKYGVTLLIIEHDLDLVRSVTTELTVLNFGEVLASGSQEEVLSNKEVLKAYMGETEMM
ncbi:MAG: hypothetical protein RLZZ600_81 [Actinomycetota bacterium]|jgi:branched-chain amino acid transport system permease protein